MFCFERENDALENEISIMLNRIVAAQECDARND